MDIIEKTVTKNYIYHGKILNLRRDEIETAGGEPAVREVVEHNGGAAVVAVTDKDEILLVRQYRYAVGGFMTEIPAGKLEKGEDPAYAVARELCEETGAVAERIYPLGWLYVSPGYTTEKLYLYAAEGLSFGDQHLDPDEYLDVIRMPFMEALEKTLGEGFCDAKTDAAILKLAHLRSRGCNENKIIRKNS